MSQQVGVDVVSHMSDVNQLVAGLAACGYIAGNDLATTLHLAQKLDRPVLLEGDAGVGKTAIALALAQYLNCELIRLQCYEGLDSSMALYEWNYQRQLMTIRLHEQSDRTTSAVEEKIFSEEFLLKRPLLQAILSEQQSVLLIDELDRADDEFEAFLLELLAEFQITIPEIGTIKAKHKPLVILTSNATRDLSDALRRRCLYHFVDYPSREKELQILLKHLPMLPDDLSNSIVGFIQNLRQQNLKKTPGIAETLDWASALLQMQVTDLHESLPEIESTLSCVLKTRSDREQVNKAWINQVLEHSTNSVTE